MKRLTPAGLISFLQNNRNMMEADLFVITLPNGEVINATSGQWDITVPEGAGGWSGPTTTFYATQYGRWSRGTITSEATFNMSANTMALTCAPQPATAFPGNPVGILNASLNGLFDASQVAVYTAYFAMGQYGKLAGGVVSAPPQLVLSEIAVSAYFGNTVSTTPVDTGNASIDFIVLAVNNYDSAPSEIVLSDTINGAPSGNTWTLVPISGSRSVGFIPFFYYCYNPNTGINHTWTISNPTGNGCPQISVMAFTGMPTSGGPENSISAWSGAGGNDGPMTSADPSGSTGLLCPFNEGDLIIAAASIWNIVGKTVTEVAGQMTVTGTANPYTTGSLTSAYALATQGLVDCTGNVVIPSGSTDVTISVQDPSFFTLPQTCTGTVVMTDPTGGNTAAVSVPDSSGFTPGMVVFLGATGWTGDPNSQIANSYGLVISTAAGVITIAMPTYSALTPGTYTGQAGTVYMAVELSGFTGGASTINTEVNALIVSASGPDVIVSVADGTPGTYTGQTSGRIGIPYWPVWSWGGASTANATGGAMVVFPGNPTTTGPGGIETKFKGTITRIVDVNRLHVEFEVGDPMYLLNMKVPRRLMQPNCPWSVTDENCTLAASGVDVNGFNMTQAFTLASGTQYVLFPATPFVQPEGYFSQGVVTCTAGNNAGLSQTVKLHASGELQLLNPWLLPVSVGDTFSVLVGCDHTPTTCTVKFGNLINFGGTPFVPPSEAAV